MNYHETENQKTDAELCQEYPSIQPEYTRAHVVAEKVMAQFQAEHFEPIVKKLADHLQEHLWDLVRDNIIEDTEQNIAGHIRDRVESSVKALLTGEEWALNKYALHKYDHASIRKKIAEHIPQELQDLRLKEVEAENKQLHEALDLERRIRSGY